MSFARKTGQFIVRTDNICWVVSDDKDGLTYANQMVIENLDEFFEFARYLHSVGFRNVRLLNEVQLGDSVIRVGDD